MPGSEMGSLTKEPPLSTLDRTIQLVGKGLPYAELLAKARADHGAHRDAPGLVRSRFLLLSGDRVVFDRFLSLVDAHGIGSPLVRKVMYFTWAWRDPRLRRFIVEKVVTAEGRWSVSKLVNKSNATFFDQWFNGSTLQKARSNIEFFLEETGIFDRAKSSIHLDLEDGWLAEAMAVAAQHEPDRGLRGIMVRDPVGTLLQLDLLALADITPAQAEKLAKQPVADPAQALNDAEEGFSYPPPSHKKWQGRESKPISTPFQARVVDPVALERANASHLKLEGVCAQLIDAQGWEPRCSAAIDMYAALPAGTVLIEIKSCHSQNFHAQARRGLSQLLEYEFIYRNELRPIAAKILLVEIEPPSEKRWLTDYLAIHGVTLAWPSNGKLVTTVPVAKELTGFVHQL